MKASNTAVMVGVGAAVFGVILCATTSLAAFIMLFSYSVRGGPTPQAISLFRQVTPSTHAAQVSELVSQTPAFPTDGPEYTPTALLPSATPAARLEPTPTPSLPPIATSTPEATPTPSFPGPEATAQAQAMIDVVSTLIADGLVEDSNATYYQLPDYEDSSNDPGTYRKTLIEYSAVNFVFRADVSWETGDIAATYYRTGCGFVFRQERPDSHYLAYLGLDGRMHMGRTVKDKLTVFGQSLYVPVDTPAGNARIIFSVSGPNIVFTTEANETSLTYHIRDRWFPDGENFGLALVSGSSAVTRCKMENIELVILEPKATSTPQP